MRKLNKEVKHLKFWKKVLIVIALIIGIMAGIILYRYSILTKIFDLNEKNKEIPNIYYTWESNTGFLQETWKKDNLLLEKDTRDITEEQRKNVLFWINLENGDNLFFTEDTYMKIDAGIPSGYLPSNWNFVLNEFSERLKMAINPSISIKTVNYDGKDCYKLKMTREGMPFNIEAIYEKDTGFLLYESGLASRSNNSDWQNEERKYKYKLNSVTDEDVAKPDVSKYKYIEASSERETITNDK